MPVTRVFKKSEVDRDYLKLTGERREIDIVYVEVTADSHNTVVRQPTEQDKGDPTFRKLISAFEPAPADIEVNVVEPTLIEAPKEETKPEEVVSEK